MEKFEQEFLIRSSTSILFNYISNASALSEWFADHCNRMNDTYTFTWDGNDESADLIGFKDGEWVRFQWEDAEDDTFFEMKIKVDELTNEVALIVTDFAEEDELEESMMLWTKQINKLKGVLGS